MQFIKDIRFKFIQEFRKKNFVTDKTGVKTIELIGESFIADEDSIFGKINDEYLAKEITWYLTKEQNINWMEKPVPELWKSVANSKGDVNSNYGNLVFSHQNFNQFKNVAYELKLNADSRRAIMIYTRPTMHTDAESRSKNDFICCNTAHYLIRNNKLNVVVNFRSNDAIYGYSYDRKWQQLVLNKLLEELQEKYPKLKIGTIHWQTGSIHVYEKHFKFLDGSKK